jgi:hypothetical protein
MTAKGTPDIEVGEVYTSVEIVDGAGRGAPDLKTIVEAVLQRLHEMHADQAMRERDNRLSDRSWRSDVKPE